MNPELALGSVRPARAGVRDTVLMLRSQPMFQGLDNEGLLLMAEHGTTAVFQDGEVITPEGGPSRAVYMVKQGAIVVSRHGQHMTTRTPGEAYGALPLLAREPSTLAVASGETAGELHVRLADLIDELGDGWQRLVGAATG